MKGGMVYLHLKVDLIILRGLIDNVNLSLRSYGLRERERDECFFERILSLKHMKHVVTWKDHGKSGCKKNHV
jgi:hypothetical protein